MFGRHWSQTCGSRNNLNLLLLQLVDASVNVVSRSLDGAEFEDDWLIVVVASPPAAVISPLSQLLFLFLLAGYLSQVNVHTAVFL